MTLKDVERRHEDRIKIVCSIMSASRMDKVQPTVLASSLVEELEARRTKDLQLITESQPAHGIPNPCKGVGSNHANLISAKEAEAALRAAQGMLNRTIAEDVIRSSKETLKTATDSPTAHYRSIMEDAIRCGAAMPKTTPTPITSLEELDNLYQQIRKQFIKENP